MTTGGMAPWAREAMRRRGGGGGQKRREASQRLRGSLREGYENFVAEPPPRRPMEVEMEGAQGDSEIPPGSHGRRKDQTAAGLAHREQSLANAIVGQLNSSLEGVARCNTNKETH